MRIVCIDQDVSMVSATVFPELVTEQAARTCYASTDKMVCDNKDNPCSVIHDGVVFGLRNQDGLCPSCGRRNYTFLSKLRDGKPNPHHSVFEHVSATMLITTSRGITHELVRHRLCAFSQESTRYIRYTDSEGSRHPIALIHGHSIHNSESSDTVMQSCNASIKAYIQLLEAGVTPQFARDVLPNALATRIVMTANAREWRHILRMRWDARAHPDMVVLASKIRDCLMTWFPVMFEDMTFDK